MEKMLVGCTFLMGIRDALSIYSPNLCASMENVLRRKPLRYGFEASMGESVDDQYDPDLPLSDAEAVLAALITVEEQVGYNAKFQNRQINLLISVWRDYLEHLRVRFAPKPMSPSVEPRKPL